MVPCTTLLLLPLHASLAQDPSREVLGGYGRYCASLDVDGDGVLEIATSAPAPYGDRPGHGVVWVLDLVDQRIVYSVPGDEDHPVGGKVQVAPDIDGDGVSELVLQGGVAGNASIRSGRTGAVLCATDFARVEFWHGEMGRDLLAIAAGRDTGLVRVSGDPERGYSLELLEELGSRRVAERWPIPWWYGHWFVVPRSGEHGGVLSIRSVEGTFWESPIALYDVDDLLRLRLARGRREPYPNDPVRVGLPSFAGSTGAVVEIDPEVHPPNGWISLSTPSGGADHLAHYDGREDLASEERVWDYEFGHALLEGRDLDGDGRPDVVVGSPGMPFTIGVTALSGAGAGELLWDLRDQEVAGGSDIGVSLAWAGDLDHDGVEDLAVGSGGYHAHAFWSNGGEVLVLSGSTGELLLRLDEDWILSRWER